MKLTKLTDEDKIILRALIELTFDTNIIYQTIQRSNYHNLKSLTHNQINVLINDTIEFDSWDSNSNNLEDDLSDLSDLL